MSEMPREVAILVWVFALFGEMVGAAAAAQTQVLSDYGHHLMDPLLY